MDSEASSLYNSSNFSAASDSNSCGSSHDERAIKHETGNVDFRSILAAAFAQQHQSNCQMTSLNTSHVNNISAAVFNYCAFLYTLQSGKTPEQITNELNTYNILVHAQSMLNNNGLNQALNNSSVRKTVEEENKLRIKDQPFVSSPSSHSSLSSYSASSFMSPVSFDEKCFNEDKSKPFKKRYFGAVNENQVNEHAKRTLDTDQQQRMMKKPLRDKSVKKEPPVPGQPKKSKIFFHYNNSFRKNQDRTFFFFSSQEMPSCVAILQ
jgi:hypothetical protein